MKNTKPADRGYGQAGLKIGTDSLTNCLYHTTSSVKIQLFGMYFHDTLCAVIVTEAEVSRG